MMDRLGSRFRRDARGQIAVIFAIALIPLIGVVGASIDYGRAVSARNQLGQALDAAILSLGRQSPMSDAEAKAYVEDYVDTILTASDIDLDFSVSDLTQEDGVVDVDVTGHLETVLMGVLGIEEMDVAVSAQVRREAKRLEIALVLDNTGSMNGGGKIQALRNAASELVDILSSDDNAEEFVRISLVPFVTTVNVNRDGAFPAQYLDQNGRSKYHGAFFDFDEAQGTAAGTHMALFDTMPNASWKGCVEARAEPYDLLDTSPDQSNPDTLFVPYFWPDERDGSNKYNNNYLPDGIGGSNDARQRHVGKYTSAGNIDESPPNTRGPNKACPQPLLPLTNDFDQVQDEIDDMIGWNSSGTNIAMGMAWGWRVLSPAPPFTQGLPFNDEETDKAMVVLTDGENVVWGGWDGHNKSDYTGYGYLAHEGAVHRLGSLNKNTAAKNVNDKVELLCDRIKAQGVRLYTITFKLSSNALQNLFRDCASEPSLYFNSPSNEQLTEAFQQIAFDLSRLRLSK